MLDPDEDSQFKLTYGVSSSGLAIQEEQHGLQMDQQSSKTAKLEKMHKMDMLLGRFQEGWTVMQFQLALQYAGWCKPLAIQDAGWSKPLSNYSPPISSWSTHDWSSHDWEHVQPSTSREAFFRNMHKVLHHADEPDEQPDEQLGAQCEDYTIVERLAKLEGRSCLSFI